MAQDFLLETGDVLLVETGTDDFLLEQSSLDLTRILSGALVTVTAGPVSFPTRTFLLSKGLADSPLRVAFNDLQKRVSRQLQQTKSRTKNANLKPVFVEIFTDHDDYLASMAEPSDIILSQIISTRLSAADYDPEQDSLLFFGNLRAIYATFKIVNEFTSGSFRILAPSNLLEPQTVTVPP